MLSLLTLGSKARIQSSKFQESMTAFLKEDKVASLGLDEANTLFESFTKVSEFNTQLQFPLTTLLERTKAELKFTEDNSEKITFLLESLQTYV